MPADHARFLANSPDRLALLSELAAGPASPSELAAENDASRRSVQRNLAELADRGWVESSGGTYRLTVTGELVAEEHAEYVGSLSRIDDFAPFFRHLPDRDHAPDPTWLADAELAVSTAEDPHAPVHQYVRSVETFDADRVRMLSPVLSRLFHDAHASVGLRGVHTELVMPTRMVERARERNPIEFDVVTATDVLSLHRYPDSFGIGLTLGDERVLMGAYDDERRLRALVDSDESQFHAWASKLFDRYRERCGQLHR
jgi:predicted transcriptional regulator